jgi:hypothetical protein
MVAAIIGSRKFNAYNFLIKAMDGLNLPLTKVVSGCAGGADTLGEAWAKMRGLEFQGFPADWDNLDKPNAVIRYNRKTGKPYNANAGFERNKDIVEAADVVIAFWDMKSGGTRDSLSYAKKTGKKWIVFDISKFI